MEVSLLIVLLVSGCFLGLLVGLFSQKIKAIFSSPTRSEVVEIIGQPNRVIRHITQSLLSEGLTITKSQKQDPLIWAEQKSFGPVQSMITAKIKTLSTEATSVKLTYLKTVNLAWVELICFAALSLSAGYFYSQLSQQSWIFGSLFVLPMILISKRLI